MGKLEPHAIESFDETPEYAEYFVRLFGKNRYKKITRNRSLDSRGRSSISSSQEEAIEDAISSGELLSIPPASLKVGAMFYVKTSERPTIFKLKFPIIPLERPYPDSVEADWLKRGNTNESVQTISPDLSKKIDENIKNNLLIKEQKLDPFEEEKQTKNIDLATENSEQNKPESFDKEVENVIQNNEVVVTNVEDAQEQNKSTKDNSEKDKQDLKSNGEKDENMNFEGLNF